MELGPTRRFAFRGIGAGQQIFNRHSTRCPLSLRVVDEKQMEQSHAGDHRAYRSHVHCRCRALDLDATVAYGVESPTSEWARSWPERLVTAGQGFWFYAAKLLWPYPLIVVYPKWEIDASQWSSYLPLLAAMIALCILGLKLKSWSRAPFFAYASFGLALLPVLGLLNNTFLQCSFVAGTISSISRAWARWPWWGRVSLGW